MDSHLPRRISRSSTTQTPYGPPDRTMVQTAYNLLSHNNGMLSAKDSSGLSSTTRTKSKSIPVKKSPQAYDDDGSFYEEMYRMATWQMYYRITNARKGTLTKQEDVSRCQVVYPEDRQEPFFQESTRTLLHKASYEFHRSHVPTQAEDNSQYGEVFELDM